MAEFAADIVGREAPVDRGRARVALLFPGGDRRLHGHHRGQPAVQTLGGQDAQLDFDQIEPTAVFGSVMKLDSAREPVSLLRTEGGIERGGGMGVEVVDHQPNGFGGGIVDVRQFPDPAGEVAGGALRADPDVAPTAVAVDGHRHAAGSTAGIFVIDPAAATGSGREGRRHLGPQRTRALIEADHRATRIGGFGIQIEDGFHAPDEGRGQFGDAPLLALPGLEVVFLSVRRTVSSEMRSTTPRATSRSASNCMVHGLSGPRGLSVQARAMSVASWALSRSGAAPGRVRSLSAAATPSSAHRRRMRPPVAAQQPPAAATSASNRSSAASSRMRARRSSRAEATPLVVNARNRSAPPRSRRRDTLWAWASRAPLDGRSGSSPRGYPIVSLWSRTSAIA